MRWDRLLFSGLTLVYLVAVAMGCRSLPRPEPVARTDRWVCPEFADQPLRHGLYEVAIKEHLRVLLEDPDNALAHYHLGYAYGQVGDHGAEVHAYGQAIHLGLTREDLFYNLGMAYAELGVYEQAEQALLQAVATAPNSGENRRALGMVYYQQQHFHEAIASCERATLLEPENPHAWHCLAVALAGAGKVEESRAALEQVHRLDAHYPLDSLLLELFQGSGGKNQSP